MNGLRHFTVGKPPASRAKGNRRWFYFWFAGDAMRAYLREYSGDPHVWEKLSDMTWDERFAFAESIGLIKDDGTGIYPSP